MPSNFSPNYQALLASNITTLLFYTENGGNAATVNQFTYAGVARSTYSFGVMQFDVGNSAAAQGFLASIGFTPSQIQELSQHGGLSSSTLAGLNSQLQQNEGALQAFTENQALTYVNQISSVIDYLQKTNSTVANAIQNTPDLQLALADYINQFGPMQGLNGTQPGTNTMLSYLSGNSVTLAGGTLQLNGVPTADDIQAFIDNTTYGVNHPAAVSGRIDNYNRGVAQIDSSNSSIFNQTQSTTGSLGDPLGTPAIIDDDPLPYGTSRSAADQLAQDAYPVPTSSTASTDPAAPPADPSTEARSELAGVLAQQLGSMSGTFQIYQGTGGGFVVTGTNGATININSDLSGNTVVPLDANGSSIQYSFDKNGVTQETSMHNVSITVDSRGNTTETYTDTVYDSNNNAISETTSLFSFDENGNPIGAGNSSLLPGHGSTTEYTGFASDGATQYSQTVTTSQTGAASAHISGDGDTADLSDTSVTLESGSQATVIGTGDVFSLGTDSTLTLGTSATSVPSTTISTDGQANSTLDFDGSSVVLGPIGHISQSSTGALSVILGTSGTAQVALSTGDSTGSPIQFSGIDSMTLNLDGSYSLVDQSGNPYTLQPCSGSSTFVLGSEAGALNVTFDADSITGVTLGQNVSIQTSAGGSLTFPASGDAGTLSLSNLGNVSLNPSSSITIGANTVDVSAPGAPGAGTTNQYSFAGDGAVSSIATYDDSSADIIPTVVSYFNSSGVPTQLLTNGTDGSSQLVVFNAANPSAGFITQTQNYAEANATGALLTQTTNFTNGLSEIDVFNPSPGAVVTRTVYTGADGSGGTISQTTNFSDGTSQITTYASSDDTGLSSNGVVSTTTTYQGWDGSGATLGTTMGTASGSSLSDSQIGDVLGSKIGQILGGNSVLESIGFSSVLGTLGKDIGETIDVANAAGSTAGDVSNKVEQLADNALGSVATAGAGAVGAYLTGELVKDLGITALPGQIIDTGAGYAVATIASNLTGDALGLENVPWNNALQLADFANVFASFAGVEVASLVTTWDTPAEADLASIGAAVGGAVGTAVLPGFGTFVGSFLGDLFGGLIGSLFGGKPNPWCGGTLLVANNSQSPFSYVLTASHDHGPNSYLDSIGNAISSELNSIVSVIGAPVANASTLSRSLFLNVQVPENNIRVVEGNDVLANFNISDSSDFVNFVVFDQLSEMTFDGGDAYIERAVNATVAQWQNNHSSVDLDSLLGNIQIAKDYEKYVENENTINDLIAKDPTSAFSAGWIIELQQAASLNLANGSTAPVGATAGNSLDYKGWFFYNMTGDQISSLVNNGFNNKSTWVSSNNITLDGTNIPLQLQNSNLSLVTNGSGDEIHLVGATNSIVMNGDSCTVVESGDANSVIANGVDDSISVYGNNNSITANGASATVLLYGQGNVLTNGNGDVTVADNSSATVNGLAENLSIWNSSAVTVNGGQMTVAVEGSGSSVTLNGDNELVTITGDSNAFVGNGRNDSVTIWGTDESLTLGSGTASLADGVSVRAFGEAYKISVGNEDQVTVDGQGVNVAVGGHGDAITVNGSSVAVSGSAFESTITENGAGNSVSFTGDGNVLTGNGNGDGGYIADTGNDNSLTSNGRNFTMIVSGSGNKLTENGDLGSITANGNGNTVNANGHGITVSMGGGNNIVTIGNGTASFASGSEAVLNGVADTVELASQSTVTVNGGNMMVSISGSESTVTANGDNNTLNLQGGNNSLAGNGSHVKVEATGNSNHVLLNGNADTLSIVGSENVFEINGQQNVVTVQGTDNTFNSSGLTAIILDGSTTTVNGGGNNITVSNGDKVKLSGSGFDLVETGTYSNVTASGDYEIATVGGEGNSLTISGNDSTVQIGGTSNAITVSGLSAMVGVSGTQQTLTDNEGNITVAASSQLNLVGNGSIIALNASDTLTVDGSNNWINVGANDTVTMTGTGNGIGGSASGVNVNLDGNGQYADLNSASITVQADVQASLTGNANTVSVGAGGVLTVIGTGNAIQMNGATLTFPGSEAPIGGDPESGSSESGFEINGFDYSSYTAGQFSSTAGAESLRSLAQTGANSVSLVVTQYVQNVSDINIEPSSATESDASLEQAIATAQAEGLSVTLKPHLDVADGTWRAYLDPSNVAQFFANYQAMIVHYAEIAQATGAGMLVIGTEMESLSGSAYEPYWDSLIGAVRQVYSGKLTYASGWNETANVSFWNKLDTIGADAYIPVTSETDPSLQQLESGWTSVSSDSYAASVMNNMSPLAFYESMSQQYDKPLLFTEIGYQSVNDTNQLEGNFQTSNWVDFQQQSQALQAFFSTFSNNGGNWFEGAYLWNWEANPAGVEANDFSVQGKPALNIVDYWFGKKNGSGSVSAAANSVNGDSNALTIGNGEALDVAGNGNTITLVGNGAVNVDGQSNSVVVAGGNNVIQTTGETTINLSGNGTTAITDGDSDSITAVGMQDGLAVNSNGSTVTIAGPADALTLSGNGSTINVTGVNDSVSVSGTGNTINVSGGAAVIQTNGANTVELNANGSSTSVEGNGDVIGINGTGDSLVVAGTGSTIAAGDGANSISLDSGNYQVSVGNGNNTITAGDGADVITVGSAANSIVLGNGNDTVVLGDGADSVTLGSGNDALTLGAGDDRITLGGNDALTFNGVAGDSGNAASVLITDGSNASSQSNELIFSHANSDQLWFSRSSDDLLISVIGTSSQIDIAGWFDGNATTVQEFAAADGKLLTSDDVNALVSAMASFSPPAAGSTTLPDSYQNQLQSVIAANWH